MRYVNHFLNVYHRHDSLLTNVCHTGIGLVCLVASEGQQGCSLWKALYKALAQEATSVRMWESISSILRGMNNKQVLSGNCALKTFMWTTRFCCRWSWIITCRSLYSRNRSMKSLLFIVFVHNIFRRMFSGVRLPACAWGGSVILSASRIATWKLVYFVGL